MRTLSAAFVLLAAATAASADQVFLRGGGQIAGEIVAERADAIVIEVGPGRISLPRSAVTRIVRNGSDLATYRGQAARLAQDDVAGWAALAQWAADRDLLTQAREAFEHVLALDPGHERAQRGLGRVKVDGRWLTPEEAYRAQGLVPFEGRWVSPEERAAMVEERAASAAARAAQAEAEARVREAEARARAAEADARRAEADAGASAVDGIPYPWVFGGGPALYPPIVPSVVVGFPGARPVPSAGPSCPVRAHHGPRVRSDRADRSRAENVPAPPAPAALPARRPRH